MFTAGRNGKLGAAAKLGFAALLLGSLVACAESNSGKLKRVAAENPSVTYKYETDQDLLAATQKATAFCDQYKSMVSQPGAIVNQDDGDKVVTFECVPVATGETAAQAAMPMTYTYRTPQELLQLSNNAEATCQSYGQTSTANITANGDGSKTVTFQCVP